MRGVRDKLRTRSSWSVWIASKSENGMRAGLECVSHAPVEDQK